MHAAVLVQRHHQSGDGASPAQLALAGDPDVLVHCNSLQPYLMCAMLPMRPMQRSKCSACRAFITWVADCLSCQLSKG